MTVTLSQRQEACARHAVRTVAYFAANGWAPTAVDVWRWMDSPAEVFTLGEVVEAMEALKVSGRLVMNDGRFCFSGSERLIERDHRAFRDARTKMKRARRVARWVSWVPGVRGTAIANTLAWEHTRPEGDIDFFVIARTGTLWFVRLCTIVPLILLRARPGIRRHHSIDFTFFVADTHLDLSTLQSEPNDPYLAAWIVSLVWLVNDGVVATFNKANPWAFERFPNAAPLTVAWYDRINARPWKMWRMARWGNAMARSLSMRRFPAAIRSTMNTSTAVVVNDDVLKFHVTDRRREIFETWVNLCKQHGGDIVTP